IANSFRLHRLVTLFPHSTQSQRNDDSQTTQSSEERNDFMSKTDKKMDRRTFLQVTGATALTTLQANIDKALAIPANNRTGTIKRVGSMRHLRGGARSLPPPFGQDGGWARLRRPASGKTPSPADAGGNSSGPGLFAAGGCDFLGSGS